MTWFLIGLFIGFCIARCPGWAFLTACAIPGVMAFGLTGLIIGPALGAAAAIFILWALVP